MADVQVDSAELQDGTLTVFGSGFTRTTTELFVDGKSVPFTINDQGQIEAEVEDASEVWAVKGDVESDHINLADQQGGTANANFPVQGSSDVSTQDLATAANAGAPVKQQIPEPNREPLKEGEHLTDDFRTRVETTGVVSIEEHGIGPRDPYPTGNPQDPNWGYRQAHGHEPKRPEDNADPRPIGLEGLERARGEHRDDWQRRRQAGERQR